jgi:hypothetical protein
MTVPILRAEKDRSNDRDGRRTDAGGGPSSESPRYTTPSSADGVNADKPEKGDDLQADIDRFLAMPSTD